MKKETIHVILATYNPQPYFSAQLKSILSQKNVSVQVTIFDDGSTDDSLLVESSDLNDPRVTLVKCSPLGSAGKNFIRAIKMLSDSSSDWILFSDQDDIWLEDKIHEGIQFAKSKNADGYSSDLSLYDGTGIYGDLTKNPNQTEFDHFFQGASAGCTYIIGKELFRKIQTEIAHINPHDLNTVISHDWLVYFIARINGFTWVHDSRSFILYRQHENNVYGAKKGIFGFFSKLSLIYKGIPKENTKIMADLCKRSDLSNPITQCETPLQRILFVRHFLKLRREKRLSLVAYVLWISGSYYPFNTKSLQRAIKDKVKS